jgi:hypothetical protein
MAEEKPIGKVTHYFDQIGVAVIALDKSLSKGDSIHIKGKKTDLTQSVDSMQIEHAPVDKVEPGQDFGIKVDSAVDVGDEVFKV